MESHTESGNRSVDKQRVEVLGADGRYQPDSDTEKETIKVNDTTTRTVERTYKWDADGRKLALVTEEEARNFSKRRYSGDPHGFEFRRKWKIFRLCNAMLQTRKRQARMHKRRKLRFIARTVMAASPYPAKRRSWKARP